MNPEDYIPKPCHENWNTMSGDDRQKFCDKCSTSVHNLSGMSREEIITLKAKNGGKLCGTFRISKPPVNPLVRPLVVGSSIASLALAACTSEKPRDYTPQHPPKEEDNNKHSDGRNIDEIPPVGMIALPPEKPVAKDPNEPEQPIRLLGEVCPPDPVKPPEPEEPMILGKICPPDPPKKNIEPRNQA